ncbi:MAG: RNA polymerase sigma factor [Bacteroidetes bacterium]|nr:RNA polymerase sigma factor [Bacteroidota bacterium]
MKASLSDQEIIKGCIKGVSLQQYKLYRKYSPKMFGVCLRYAPDYHTAEDLLQEGFIKVYKNIATYRSEGSFEGWLRRIFVNTAIENFRKSVHMYPIAEINGYDKETYHDDVVSKITVDELLGLLQHLSVGYRTIFNLYAIEGYSHREIAEQLDISEGTSKSQLARARKLLQRMLAGIEKQEAEIYVR